MPKIRWVHGARTDEARVGSVGVVDGALEEVLVEAGDVSTCCFGSCANVHTCCFTCFTGRSDCIAAAPMSSTLDATVVGCPGGAVPPAPPAEAGVGSGFPSLDAIVGSI